MNPYNTIPATTTQAPISERISGIEGHVRETLASRFYQSRAAALNAAFDHLNNHADYYKLAIGTAMNRLTRDGVLTEAETVRFRKIQS